MCSVHPSCLLFAPLILPVRQAAAHQAGDKQDKGGGPCKSTKCRKRPVMVVRGGSCVQNWDGSKTIPPSAMQGLLGLKAAGGAAADAASSLRRPWVARPPLPLLCAISPRQQATPGMQILAENIHGSFSASPARSLSNLHFLGESENCPFLI